MLVFSLDRQEKHIIERQHYFMVIALHGSVIMCLERSGRNWYIFPSHYIGSYFKCESLTNKLTPFRIYNINY